MLVDGADDRSRPLDTRARMREGVREYRRATRPFEGDEQVFQPSAGSWKC